ncbi:hypothetical protein V1514DRAFT_66865 [Lipomyces japonicus]|uniref:uncharacterized protein n=1 Tax=Lipomyces japonicus TaxID=56871 RepID=UPI0034CF4790
MILGIVGTFQIRTGTALPIVQMSLKKLTCKLTSYMPYILFIYIYALIYPNFHSLARSPFIFFFFFLGGQKFIKTNHQIKIKTNSSNFKNLKKQK